MSRILVMVVGILMVAGWSAGVAGASAPAGSSTTVSFDAMQYSAASNSYFPKFVKEFEAKNPSTHIDLRVINWTQGHQVIGTEIGGGHAPDVAIIGTRWLPEYASQNLLEPVTKFTSAAALGSQYYAGVLKSVQYRGVQYALPEAASVRLLIYNRSLFKKAGISSPPTTWTQLAADAVKIHHSTGQAGYGLVGSQVETDLSYYYTMWGFGGDILRGKQALLSSSPDVKALQFLVTMIKNGGTESAVTAATRVSLENTFAAGKLGMMIDGPWLVKAALANHVSVAEANEPAQPGVKRRNVVITDSMVMFKNSHEAAAWKLMQFLFSKQIKGQFDLTEGMLPTTTSVGTERSFRTSPVFKAYLKAYQGQTVFEPVVARFDAIALDVTNAVAAAYSGSASPAQALGRANDLVNRILQH